MQTYDVVVIGAGAMGSAAARALAAAGREVLVLEQYELGHDRGGSHGGTRLFRLAINDEAELLRAARSRELWHELESETGVQMLDLVGGVDHGIGEQQVRESAALLERHGVQYDLLTPEAATERWPGMRFDGAVLYQPGSGRALAEQALTAIRESARALGVEFRAQCAATAVRVVGDGVEVETAAGVVRAGQVVVTAGPWTGQVLAGALEVPAISASQEQPRFFAPLDPAAEWPIFVDRRAATPAYGLFEEGHGVKVGLHATGPVISLDQRDFQVEPGRDAALIAYVREWFPGLDVTRSEAISCLYDNTERGDFVIDRRGPISVAAGFHGEGFKFVPLVARYLTELVTGSGSVPDVFRL
ncbi:FAD-dependent oxidoreductase [Streptomyces sp. SID13031]|uniref:FAD-dependent oxidoreductase n=1 Tax=Streptomyces sp. SID13031 TaxID=2706046 RepID=UPI0013C65327|nr:FAD-dependent oxidoreductase [Streptomyces sp. SID13031]NEA33781.1 FAD-dependent oxidoreductase [Streptomyces sp. SID13031]